MRVRVLRCVAAAAFLRAAVVSAAEGRSAPRALRRYSPRSGAREHAAREQGFGTRAVHAGQHLDEVFGAVVPPVHLSSTYAPVKVGELRRGYDYGRGTNPTRDALQEQLAALEAGTDETGAPKATALTFASGLAAETALIMGAAEPGTTIVMGNDVYGGSYRLISKVLAKWGIRHAVVDMAEVDGREVV